MRYVIISLVCAILYWILDGIVVWNPYARKLYQAYQTNTKPSFSLPKSLFVYLIYGFAMAGLFLLLYNSLPGETGIVKGICFGLIAWYFRGFTTVMSQWIFSTVSLKTMGYAAITGVGEALILGMFLGLTLKG